LTTVGNWISLLPRGEKRGRYYVASEALLQLQARVREARKVEDPFEET
jgi:hypothetical protein